MRPTRRSFNAALAAAVVSPAFPWERAARADAPAWRHGVSLFGSVKYPADFKHFDYVNPNAPKGGAVRMIAVGAYDNFNYAVSGTKGTIGMGMERVYDTLMAQAFDEVSTEYGLIAEAVSHPDDFAWAKFRLRADAKWHDGKPITVEDVIYSLDVLKQHNPMLGAYYRHVAKAEKTGEREVTFTFDATGNRELPQILGQLTVLPKHYWEGEGANGRKRDISVTTLEPPLGSGPYRIKSFEAGRNIVYERVKEYWGKNLPVAIGRDNFDEIRYEYFRDGTVALEAFKADQIDFRSENSAKNWATAYDFPAVRDKRVLLEEFAIRSQGVMQAFVFNTRRPKFADARVRRALNYAFDFEEINKLMFYGQYIRIDSYFKGTELAWNSVPPAQSQASSSQATSGSSGVAAPPAQPGSTITAAAPSDIPDGLELEILNTVRDKVPPEVFTTPYRNPTGGSPDAMRGNLRDAMRLFKEAGYEIRDRRMVNAKTGEPFAIDILLSEASFERIALFLKPTLDRLGVGMTVRTVDDSQYENRLRNRDYDIIIASWGQSLSPGNEQLSYWGSRAADQPGSRNYAGIKNPAVDTLIDRIIFAKNREELVAATQALDRVLIWNFYVIPQWTYGKQRTARWDRFGHPDRLPAYAASAFPTVWWWDAERAAKVGTRQ